MPDGGLIYITKQDFGSRLPQQIDQGPSDASCPLHEHALARKRFIAEEIFTHGLHAAQYS
jgi:hypothetical protein